MEKLHGIPDILFKFREWTKESHRRILTHNEIFLASVDQFNDPFDTTLPFRYNDEELTQENLFLKLLQKGREMWPDISELELHQRCFERQNSGVFGSGEYWKSMHAQFKEEINRRYGILSLTSKNDNLLMWAHYSNSHTGFCVGFDKHVLFETIQGNIGPVIYSDKFPRIRLNDNNLVDYIAMLMTKSLDWSYEEEFRVTKIDARRCAVTLPNEAIKQVVLGLKMSDIEKDEVLALVRQRLPNIDLYEAQMSEEEFKLILVPILKN